MAVSLRPAIYCEEEEEEEKEKEEEEKEKDSRCGWSVACLRLWVTTYPEPHTNLTPALEV